MNEKAEYQSKLLGAMQSCNQSAIENIQGAIANWPVKATAFSFDTFIDQDAEGFVSVIITPDGPDSYVLCKAIEGFRDLFDVQVVDGKLNHALPLFDPDDVQFDIRTAVSETAFQWITFLIELVGKESFPVPIRFTNCDYEVKSIF